jgi:hypothetical protein
VDIRLLSNNSYLCVNRYDTLTWVGMDQGGRGYFVFLLFCLEKSVYGPCWMYFCRPHRKNSQGQWQCFYEEEMNDGPKDFYFSSRIGLSELFSSCLSSATRTHTSFRTTTSKDIDQVISPDPTDTSLAAPLTI